MREIKFRGKCLDNGEWVYGDLHIRTPFPHIHSEIDYSKVNIDPHTVGQFTGLHDKDGKEIYEGDVVTQTWGSPHFVNGVLYDCYGRIGDIRYECDLIGVHTKNGMYRIVGCGLSNTVIGNIHDNPELLETE